jgi:hypothetical protein
VHNLFISRCNGITDSRSFGNLRTLNLSSGVNEYIEYLSDQKF